MPDSHKELETESSGMVDENATVEDLKTKDVKRKCPKLCPFPGLGIVCAILTAFCYALNTLLVKLVEDLHPIQISLSQVSVQFLILLPLMQYKRDEVDILGPEGLRFYLWLRGLAGSTAMIFLYIAVNLMSVGNAVTIAYVSMIILPFMARIFLKESLTVLDVIFAVASLVGVVLIAQPTFLFPVAEGEQAPSNSIGVLFALGSALLQATSFICLRKLGKRTHLALNVLYLSICGGFTTMIWLSIIQEWRLPCRSDLPYIFCYGIIGVSGQCFLTAALQHERAGTVGVLRSTQIIMVYVFQIIILGDIPTMLSVIGAVLILSSSAGIGIRKIINEQRRRNAIEKRTRCSPMKLPNTPPKHC